MSRCNLPHRLFSHFFTIIIIVFPIPNMIFFANIPFTFTDSNEKKTCSFSFISEEKCEKNWYFHIYFGDYSNTL